MGKTIKAKFSNGVIKPLEEVKIAEGEEITVTIIETPSEASGDAFGRSAGGWRGTINAEELIKGIYDDRLVSAREVPTV